MKFWEAMKALEEGKKVRCKNWRPGAYIGLNSSMILYSYNTPGWVLDMYYRDDWELYEEARKRLLSRKWLKD